MNAFLTPGLQKIYVPCGTKFGKSISGSTCMAKAALKKRGGVWRWIAPQYSQAMIGADYFRKILPPSPHSEFKEAKMRHLLPYLDSRIEYWHAKNPIALEGEGTSGSIYDEAAKIIFDAVTSNRTTHTRTRGPEMFISTPFGKNWFYRESQEAKAKMLWALKKGKVPTHAYISARTIDNPFIDPQVVIDAKETMPDRLFRQYYLAEFVDDGQVFIGFKDCIQGPSLDLYGAAQFWMAPECEKDEVLISIDWAKKEDFTVFGAFKCDAPGIPRMVGLQRFQGIGYVQQLKELYNFGKKFKNVRIIYHDKTGVGEALDDMLGQLPFAFEGITFTAKSKAHMVNELMVAFQKKELGLPNWPEMLKELESYEVTTNELGNFRYTAPSGQHDDIVSMLMMAQHGLQDYGASFELDFLEDLPKKQKQNVQSWYNDIIEEDDDNPATHLFNLR